MSTQLAKTIEPTAPLKSRPFVLPYEQWKDIEGYEGTYQVSSYGRVRSLARAVECSSGVVRRYKGQVLKLGQDKDGYRQVTLCGDRKRNYPKVHRLVLLAFVGLPPTSRHEANHRDGDKANNHIGNLEWLTPGDNQRHAYESGLRQNKLSPAEAEEIRKLYSFGDYLQREIGAMFGVSGVTISMITRGKIWVSMSQGANDD